MLEAIPISITTVENDFQVVHQALYTSLHFFNLSRFLLLWSYYPNITTPNVERIKTCWLMR